MSSKLLIPALIALMGVSAGAWADEPDKDGEVTIRLMPPSETQLPEAVTNPIELPAHLLDDPDKEEKLQKAKQALQKASTRRANGANHGLSHAEQARQAREQAQDMVDDAKANRESRGRSDDLPEPPNRPQDPPGRP